MAVDAGFVGKIFAGLEHGDGAAFFSHVADDVDWIVMGTHPLAGHYKSKADFTAGTFAKLACSVRKRFISTSGFTPSSSLR